jgi:hypothetical protein
MLIPLFSLELAIYRYLCCRFARAAQEEREEIERDLRQAQNDHREIPNPFQDEALQLSGWLDKESSGRFQKRWQRRWCVLTNNSLVWFHNQYEDIPSGSIHLDEVIDISIVGPFPLPVFRLVPPSVL